MNTHELVINCLERVKARISANIDSTGTRASGRTQESMHIEETMNGGTLFGRPFFQSVETGRPKGNTPKGFVSIIRQWIIDKGLSVAPLPYKRKKEGKYSPQQRGLNAMAGAIAHKIREEGTSLYRKGGREDIYTDVVREEIDQLKEDVTQLMKDDILAMIANKGKGVGSSTIDNQQWYNNH